MELLKDIHRTFSEKTFSIYSLLSLMLFVMGLTILMIYQTPLDNSNNLVGGSVYSILGMIGFGIEIFRGDRK